MCVDLLINILFANLILISVEAYGMANLIEPIRPTPETVASICYTSVSNIFLLRVPLFHLACREPLIRLKVKTLSSMLFILTVISIRRCFET